MTPAQLAALAAEIKADPACAVALAAKDCVELARLKSIGRTKFNDREIGNGTILSTLGIVTGNSFLDILLSASGDSPFRHVKPLIEQGRLLIGSPLVQATVQSFVPAILTSDQASALTSLGLDPAPLSAKDIADALFNNDGSLK